MADTDQNSGEQQEFTLPIDIPTLLKALFQKKWWLLIIVVLGAALGVGGALMLGTQSYEAVTVMYYQPVASALSDQFIVYQSIDADTSLSYQQGAQLTKREDSSMSLNTLVNMVEITPNFERLRNELDLEMSLEQIGSAIFVDTARDTNLMLIHASSEDRNLSAELANAIRDIFLDNIKKITMTELNEQIKNLDVQIENIDSEIALNSKEFREFLVKNDLEDVDLVNTPYATEYLKTEVALENDKSQITVYTMEIDKINETIAQTNNLIENEKSRSSQGLTQDDLSVQILQLQDQSAELRQSEVSAILIQQEEDLYRIAQEQFANGEIGRAELTTAQYQYELAIAQYADSTEIDYIKTQIDELRGTDVVGYGESLSYSEYLKELRLKRVDAELNLLAAEQSYNTNMNILTELQKTLDDYPNKLQQYLTLSGTIASLRAERRGLEKMQTQTNIAINQGYSDFMIVSDAIPPIYSTGSNKKILAIGIAFVVCFFGFIIVFALVFFDKRLRSAGEAALKIKQEVLTVIPRERRKERLYPHGTEDAKHIERFRLLARPLRKDNPASGAAILIASTADHEGKTMITINLAAVLGRQDERVLILEAQVRKNTKESDYKRIMFEDEQGEHAGLGEYLSYMALDLDEIVQHTTLSGVDVIPIKKEAVVPDFLQSSRMRELIEEIKQKYTIILIEAPPVADSVDAEILAQYCDTILYVAASDGPSASEMKEALARLKKTRTKLFGVVLNGVQKIYL